MILTSEDDADLLVYMAAHSIGMRDDLGPLLIEAAREGSMDLSTRLDRALRIAGRSDLVTARNTAFMDTWRQMQEGFQRLDDGWTTLLHLVASQRREAPLSFSQAWRLDELADLMATLRVPKSAADVVSTALRHRRQDVETLVSLVTELGGFDRGVVATEARRAVQDEAKGRSALLLLADAGKRREMRHWQEGAVESSLESLIRLLASTSWVSRIAAEALACSPHPETANRIEAELGKLPPLNRLYAGQAVIQVGQDVGRRAERWHRSADPFDRILAAWWFARNSSDTSLDEHCATSLADADRNVRVACVRGFRGRLLCAAVRERLQNLAVEAETGYVCIHCGTANDVVRSCKRCNIVGPELRGEIDGVLKWTHGTDGGDDDEEDE
jgi:hypothetical protein